MGGDRGGIYFYFLISTFLEKVGMESTMKKKITIQSKVALEIHELVK